VKWKSDDASSQTHDRIETQRRSKGTPGNTREKGHRDWTRSLSSKTVGERGPSSIRRDVAEGDGEARGEKIKCLRGREIHEGGGIVSGERISIPFYYLWGCLMERLLIKRKSMPSVW